MRVSDAERHAAADRLRGAMAEGRLDLLEYDTRLALAYQAVTYADLDKLFTDLPLHGAAPVVAPQPRAPAVPRAIAPARTGFAGLPLALRILWTIWGFVVALNATVWLLVGLGNGDPEYFWPMWFAVPGAALLGATLIVRSVRRN